MPVYVFMPMARGIAWLVPGVGDSASQLICRVHRFLNTQLVMSRLWKTTRAEENPTRPIPIKTKVESSVYPKKYPIPNV